MTRATLAGTFWGVTFASATFVFSGDWQLSWWLLLFYPVFWIFFGALAGPGAFLASILLAGIGKDLVRKMDFGALFVLMVLGIPLGILNLIFVYLLFGLSIFSASGLGVLGFPAIAGGIGGAFGVWRNIRFKASSVYVPPRRTTRRPVIDDSIRYGEKLTLQEAVTLSIGLFMIFSPVVAPVFFRAGQPSLVAFVLAFAVMTAAGATFGNLHWLFLRGQSTEGGDCGFIGMIMGSAIGIGGGLLTDPVWTIYLGTMGLLIGGFTGRALRKAEQDKHKPTIGPPSTPPPSQEAPPWFFGTSERERERRIFGSMEESAERTSGPRTVHRAPLRPACGDAVPASIRSLGLSVAGSLGEGTDCSSQVSGGSDPERPRGLKT